MSLSDYQAQQITLVRTLEQAQSNDSIWSVDDAKEVTQTTIDLVGSKASFPEFLARRAQLTIDTIAKRYPERAVLLSKSKWNLISLQLLAVLALVCGFLTDLLTTSLLHPGHINVVELPLIILILWNLVFMAFFFVNWLGEMIWRDRGRTSPLIGLLGKYMSFSLKSNRKRQKPWLETFRNDWSKISGAMSTTRLKVAAHLASILFTAGAFGHLFIRAGTEHYTAGFITSLPKLVTADRVHSLISWILAPGAYITGLPIPDVQHIERLRIPPGLGELAENWIYLYAGAVLAWVVIPRAYLLLLNVFVLWRMRRNFNLPMTSTYFTTLRAAWRGHPQRFLKDYRGYLQIDAYSGYDALLKSGDIVAVGCMAHARRHFFEVARKDPNPQGLAAQALAWIAKLYEIESHIKDHPPDKKLLTRQTQSRPVLDQFHLWLVGHAPGIPARSELGQAFGYALRQWETLVRYTEDGILMPDNNLIESAIRPVAVGRRSWLFLGAERGGHVAATMYSLIGTCRLNGVEPYAWLCDVLKRLPNHPVTKLAELLPFNWKRQSITQT